MPFVADSPEATSPAATEVAVPARASDKAFLPAIATMSLGKPGLHPLDKKLQAAADQGFQGVELFWDDLEAYSQGVDVSSSSGSLVDWPLPSIVVAAQKIRSLCDRLGLQIISLQPFRNYDGITDAELHAQRIAEFKVWLSVAQELGAGCIGVPSTIEPNPKTHTGDHRVIARDLRELAQLAQPYGIRIAYENLCFAAHVRTWSQAWDAVTRAGDLDNIGFLPDTFNLCGDVFADPAAPLGETAGGHTALALSIDKLVRTVPLGSMFLLQVADAEFMAPPLTEDHAWMAGCHNSKMAWSRNGRLFPFEKPGYLPILSVVERLVNAGWSGWVSLELFSRTTATEGEQTIWEHAERGWKGWEKLAAEMGWEVHPRVVLGSVGV